MEIPCPPPMHADPIPYFWSFCRSLWTTWPEILQRITRICLSTVCPIFIVYLLSKNWQDVLDIKYQTSEVFSQILFWRSQYIHLQLYLSLTLASLKSLRLIHRIAHALIIIFLFLRPSNAWIDRHGKASANGLYQMQKNGLKRLKTHLFGL